MLKISDVVGYMPYGLKIVNGSECEVVTNIDFEEKKVYSVFRGHLTNVYDFDDIVPILRSIDDLDEPLIIEGVNNGEEFIPSKYLGLSKGKYTFTSYEECEFPRVYLEPTHNIVDIQLLYKWGFDVHRLIPRGLAKDIKSI